MGSRSRKIKKQQQQQGELPAADQGEKQAEFLCSECHAIHKSNEGLFIDDTRLCLRCHQLKEDARRWLEERERENARFWQRFRKLKFADCPICGAVVTYENGADNLGFIGDTRTCRKCALAAISAKINAMGSRYIKQPIIID